MLLDATDILDVMKLVQKSLDEAGLESKRGLKFTSDGIVHRIKFQNIELWRSPLYSVFCPDVEAKRIAREELEDILHKEVYKALASVHSVWERVSKNKQV